MSMTLWLYPTREWLEKSLALCDGSPMAALPICVAIDGDDFKWAVPCFEGERVSHAGLPTESEPEILRIRKAMQ